MDGEQVDQRAAEPIDNPCHDDIELAAAGISEQGIEAWPLIAPLGASVYRGRPRQRLA